MGSPKLKKTKKTCFGTPWWGVHVEFIWLRKHIVSINPLKILNKVAPSKPSHKHNYYNWNSTFKLSSSYIQNLKKQFKLFLMLWMFPLYHQVTICYAHKTDQLLCFFCGKFSYLANLFWKQEFFWEKELCIWGFSYVTFQFFLYKKHPILIYIVRNIEGCLIKI